MRLQSILVKPYVLECLNRFERERQEELAREEALNPTKRPEFASTRARMAELNRQMQQERLLKQARADSNKSGDAKQEEEEEQDSTDSEQEDEAADSAQMAERERLRNIGEEEILKLEKTPRAVNTVLEEWLRIVYEEGQARTEMEDYKEEKIQRKMEMPVAKVHDKKNYKAIAESQQVAFKYVTNSLKTQSETLKERIQ